MAEIESQMARLHHNGFSLLTSLINDPGRETRTRGWSLIDRHLYRGHTLVARSIPVGNMTALFAYFICNPSFVTGEVSDPLYHALSEQDLLGKSASLRVIFSPPVLTPTDNPWQDAWDAGIDQLRCMTEGTSRRLDEIRIGAAVGYSIENLESWFPEKIVRKGTDGFYIKMAKECIATFRFCGMRIFGVYPDGRKEEDRYDS